MTIVFSHCGPILKDERCTWFLNLASRLTKSKIYERFLTVCILANCHHCRIFQTWGQWNLRYFRLSRQRSFGTNSSVLNTVTQKVSYRNAKSNPRPCWSSRHYGILLGGTRRGRIFAISEWTGSTLLKLLKGRSFVDVTCRLTMIFARIAR